MVKWKTIYAKHARMDAKKITASGLKSRAIELINLLKTDPYQSPPPFEKLVGDLTGAYSRHINILHRLVYQILKEQKTVIIIRMWTHYE